MQRRRFLATTAVLAAAGTASAAASRRDLTKQYWDYLIVGAGTAGLPAAFFAARRGARVLLIDAADKIGGTLHLANGQVSAGGSRTQASKGIEDHPNKHYADIIRITRGLADPGIVRLTVDQAPDTINWLLDNGLTPLDGHPVTGDSPGRPAYTTARYLWGAREGRDILAVVERQLAPDLASGQVAAQLSARVREVLRDRRGRAVGVRASTANGERVFRGRNILLTTGGYAMNPDAFMRRCGYPAYSTGAYPSNLGDGLDIAEALGARLRGEQLHRAGTGSILSANQFPAKVYARFNTVPQERQPWEIWVNRQGRRFIREDEPFTYRRELALLTIPDLRYNIVFDSTILRESPVGIPGWSRDKLVQHFDQHPMFVRADSLSALAARLQIDANGLEATVREYNQSVDRWRDPLGREFLPRRIATAPYYGVVHMGHSATSSVGIVTDAQLRVLGADGQAIPNLYAAGEVLGSGVTLGNAFTPGMMLTPALAQGRWLGRTLPVV